MDWPSKHEADKYYGDLERLPRGEYPAREHLDPPRDRQQSEQRLVDNVLSSRMTESLNGFYIDEAARQFVKHRSTGRTESQAYRSLFGDGR